jgi:hypothetical protein
MKRLTTIRLTLLLTLVTLTAAAQKENQFAVDAQLRTRGEYDNGYATLRSQGQEPIFYISDRARIALDYQRKNLELKASVQHTGIWGREDINKGAGNVTLNEAWGKMTFDPGIFVQIGRMPLSYDDERLLGAADWNNAGNWHDALRLGFENNVHRVHLFATYNQNTSDTHGGYYAKVMPYKQMQGLWYHVDLLPQMPLGISLLALNIGYEDGKAESGHTRFMQTFGGYVNFRPEPFFVDASFYYQRGKDSSSDYVSAFMASGNVSYDVLGYLDIRAGYDYLSGNDGLNYNQHAFDPLFGTHHKFFGAMDYFVGRVGFGLQDIHAGLTGHFGRHVDLSADYHRISMAESVYGFHFGKHLADEVDIHLSARIMKDVTLTAGYSMMFAQENLAYIKGGDHTSWQDWAWLSLNINPRILFTTW